MFSVLQESVTQRITEMGGTAYVDKGEARTLAAENEIPTGPEWWSLFGSLEVGWLRAMASRSEKSWEPDPDPDASEEPVE